MDRSFFCGFGWWFDVDAGLDDFKLIVIFSGGVSRWCLVTGGYLRRVGNESFHCGFVVPFKMDIGCEQDLDPSVGDGFGNESRGCHVLVASVTARTSHLLYQDG